MVMCSSMTSRQSWLSGYVSCYGHSVFTPSGCVWGGGKGGGVTVSDSISLWLIINLHFIAPTPPSFWSYMTRGSVIDRLSDVMKLYHDYTWLYLI